MIVKNIFHPKSDWSHVLVLLCWGLLIYLTHHVIGVLVAFFVLVLLLGAIRSLFRYHLKMPLVLGSINENIHTVTYSITAGMLLLAFIPHLIPENAFLDIYVMLVLVFGPTLLLTNFMVYYLHHKFLTDDSSWSKSLVVSILKTTFLVLLLIAGTAFATAHTHNIVDSHEKQLAAYALSSLSPPSDYSGLMVEKDIIDIWREDYGLITVQDIRTCTICLPSELVTDTITKADSLLSVEITSKLYDAYKNQKNNLEYIPTENRESMLENLKDELEQHEDVFLSDTPVLTPDMSPKELWGVLRNYLEVPQDNGGFELLFDINLFDKTFGKYVIGSSPLHNSITLLMQHTLLFRESISAMDRILMLDDYTPKVIYRLYDNRNVQESTDSKLLRYLMLVTYAKERT